MTVKTAEKSTIERKFFTGLELKADKPGAFTARIATLNVVDKQGDLTLPGAFPVGKSILISAYMHSSWMDALPVGKGVIREDGDQVLVDGEFNLHTETGREHYETIKFAPELQEWSYGFRVIEAEEDAEVDGNHVARVLKKLDVFEASPVLRGAGMNTATLAIKSEGDAPYATQTETVLAAVGDWLARTKLLVDLRREEGRKLSQARRERIGSVLKSIEGMTGEVKSLLVPEPPATSPEVEAGRREYLKFLKIQNGG